MATSGHALGDGADDLLDAADFGVVELVELEEVDTVVSRGGLAKDIKTWIGESVSPVSDRKLPYASVIAPSSKASVATYSRTWFVSEFVDCSSSASTSNEVEE